MNRNKRLRYTSRLVSQIGLQISQGNRDEAYRIMFDGFSYLGGVYVKFLQILSARYEFRTSTAVSAKKRMAVFDAVEPDNIDIHHTLAAEIGPSYQTELINIQTQPFAAGSFGQVYYAQHKSGMPVIIKVLRPSLLKYIRFDLKVLRVILRLLDASPIARSFDTKEVFADFKKTVLAETDYPKEVKHAVYFYEYFKNHPHVVIPKSFPSLSSKNILVQEYLTGIPMTDMLIQYEDGVDVAKVVKEQLGSDIEVQLFSLGHELLFSMLAAQKIPGDPHAGNIKLLPDNKIGLYDFGITADPPVNRMAFKNMIEEYKAVFEGKFDAGRLFVNGLRFFANRQYRAINTVAAAAKSNDPDFDLLNELTKTVNRVFSQNSSKIDIDKYVASARIAPLFRETVNEGNRFALDIEFDGTVMIKAADTYMAMLDRLGMKTTLMPRIYDSVLDRINQTDEADLKGKSDLMDLETAIEIVSSWMQELLERDPLLFHSFVAKTKKGLGPRSPTPTKPPKATTDKDDSKPKT